MARATMDDIALPPIEGLAQFEARVSADFRAAFVSRFGALFLDRLDEPGPEHEFLIDGWLSVGDRSVIGGPSQSGKSFLALHAGMCVATGSDFFGAPVKRGLVVYQAGEGARGVKKRLRAWRRHHDVEFSAATPFVLLQAPVDLYRADADTGPLIAEIKAIAGLYAAPLRLVVIDTLATATGGADENSGKDMGLVMQNVARINREFGAHVCLVHHLNAGGTKLRGHTSVYANIDQVMLVSRDETTKVRTARLDKQKDDEAGASFRFELMSVTLGQDGAGRLVTSCVCLPVGEKETVRRVEAAKGLRLSDQEIVFMQALFEADKRFGQPVPQDLAVGAGVRSVVRYDDVKRIYAGMSPSDRAPEPDASEEEKKSAQAKHMEMLKKRLQRVREFLTAAGVIGLHAPFVWHSGKPLRAFPETLPKRTQSDLEFGPPEEIPF